MTQSIVCGGCGTAVAYGRLSCPSCGELLASVAGATRRGTTAIVADAAFESSGDVVDGQLATWPDDGPGLSLTDWDDADDAVPAATEAAAVVPSPAASATSMWSLGVDPIGDVDDETPAAPPSPVPAATTPEASDLFAPTPDAPVPWVGAAAVADPAAAAPTPGAYLPPVVRPAGLPAPARAWAGHGPDDLAMASDGAPADATEGGATASAMLDREKATEFVGWLAIAGAALSLVGFLLPWSSASVIGASGVGYFDRWGLAGPGHLLVILGLAAVLAAAVLRARVPIWLGIGLPGLGLGALLVGLVWPYLIGPLGGSVGAIVVAIGAVMLGIAGVAAVVVDRHARVDPPV